MARSPKFLMLLSAVGVSLLPGQALWAQEWRPVRGGILYGISGMATIKQGKDAVELLLVHDNKDPGQGRLAILTIAGTVQPQYGPLKWQDTDWPADLESLTAVPGSELSYMAATSKGKVYYFKLSPAANAISVLKIFNLPGVSANSNFEAFALQQVEGKLLAVWADRGAGKRPATLYWGTFDLATYQTALLGSASITVPLAGAEVRHISDLKVDEAGVVYITAASDSGNDGPFQSSVYIAGSIGRQGDQWVLRQNRNLVPLYRDNYRKVEAIELLPGATGGVVLGTDDETMGSSVMVTP